MSNPELAQEWRERLEDYAQSEMTVQEWCDFNGVSTRRVREAALPPLPPLRTVHAAFTAHGSSLSNAPLRTRCSC